jgi:hypothetical protein
MRWLYASSITFLVGLWTPLEYSYRNPQTLCRYSSREERCRLFVMIMMKDYIFVEGISCMRWSWTSWGSQIQSVRRKATSQCRITPTTSSWRHRRSCLRSSMPRASPSTSRSAACLLLRTTSTIGSISEFRWMTSSRSVTSRSSLRSSLSHHLGTQHRPLVGPLLHQIHPM